MAAGGGKAAATGQFAAAEKGGSKRPRKQKKGAEPTGQLPQPVAARALNDPQAPVAVKQAAVVQMGAVVGNERVTEALNDRRAAQDSPVQNALNILPVATEHPQPAALDALEALPPAAPHARSSPQESALVIGAILHQAIADTESMRGAVASAATLDAQAANPGGLKVSQANAATIVDELAMHDLSSRWQVEVEYRDTFGEPLLETLQHPQLKLPFHEGLRIYALLKGAAHVHEPHVRLALALLVPGYKSNTELFRMLYFLPQASRKPLAESYRQTFSAPEFTEIVPVETAVTGVLAADIYERYRLLSSDMAWECDKLLALADHRITEAEEIYFETKGRVGTTTTVPAHIRSIWEQGPAAFMHLLEDWQDYVRNGSGWTSAAWTVDSLLETLRSELSGDDLRLVETIFDGFASYARSAANAMGQKLADGSSRWDQDSGDGRGSANQQALDRVQLEVAQTLFDRSDSKDEAALRSIVAIREAQIERAKVNPDWQRTLKWAWEIDKHDLALRQAVAAHVYTDEVKPGQPGEAEFGRLRLIADGTLTPVDELYFALKAGNDGLALKAALKIWLNDETLEKSEADARVPRTATNWRPDQANGDAVNREVIRPPFEFTRMRVFDGVGEQAGERMGALLYEPSTYSRAWRGAKYLKLEFDSSTLPFDLATLNTNSSLKAGLAFLQTAGLDDKQREDIVTRFVDEYVRRLGFDAASAKSPVELFLNYTAKRFHSFEHGTSTAQVELEQLLHGPPKSLGDVASRAQQRLRATHRGVLDAAGELSALTTAPETWNWVNETMERLEWMAEREKAGPEDLQTLAAFAGLKTPLELGNLEYEQFKARVEELRKAKDLAGEAMAFLIEGWGRSVLVAALGATGVGGLIAAVTAFMLGMLARKAVSGEEYDFITRANIGTHASEVTTYLLDEVIHLEALLLKLPTARFVALAIHSPKAAELVTKFVQESLKTFSYRVLEKGTSNVFEGKDFGDGKGKLVASSIVFGGIKALASMALTKNDYFTRDEDRYKNNFFKVLVGGPPPKASIANAMVSAIWDMALDPAVSAMSGPEQLKLFAQKVGQSVYLTLGVAGSFTVIDTKAGAKGRQFYGDNKQRLAPMIEKDPKVLAAHAAHNLAAKTKDEPQLDLRTFLEGNPPALGAFVKDQFEAAEAAAKEVANSPATAPQSGKTTASQSPQTAAAPQKSLAVVQDRANNQEGSGSPADRVKTVRMLSPLETRFAKGGGNAGKAQFPGESGGVRTPLNPFPSRGNRAGLAAPEGPKAVAPATPSQSQIPFVEPRIRHARSGLYVVAYQVPGQNGVVSHRTYGTQHRALLFVDDLRLKSQANQTPAQLSPR